MNPIEIDNRFKNDANVIIFCTYKLLTKYWALDLAADRHFHPSLTFVNKAYEPALKGAIILNIFQTCKLHKTVL
jgi:hypothetical protein